MDFIFCIPSSKSILCYILPRTYNFQLDIITEILDRLADVFVAQIVTLTVYNEH